MDEELASAICWCWRRMASSEEERPSWESGMEGGRGEDRAGGIGLVGGSCGGGGDGAYYMVWGNCCSRSKIDGGFIAW